MKALAMPMNDFEDAIIAVCAQKVNADCIVSRDEKFIKAYTEVAVIKPEQLLKNSIPS
jgi:predicted nucleic acid-binding protein